MVSSGCKLIFELSEKILEEILISVAPYAICLSMYVKELLASVCFPAQTAGIETAMHKCTCRCVCFISTF